MIWSPAIHLYAALLERFGEPKFLATRRVMSHGAALSLRRFLTRLEAMLRDVLMRLASRLPETKARPVRRARKRAIPAPAGRPGFANEDPAAWGVSFPLGLHRSGASGRHGLDRLPPLFVSAAPLAERLEAIARVFANPERYIRRAALLARRPFRSPDAAQRRSGVQGQTPRPSIPWAPGLASAFAGASPGERSAFTAAAPSLLPAASSHPAPARAARSGSCRPRRRR